MPLSARYRRTRGAVTQRGRTATPGLPALTRHGIFAAAPVHRIEGAGLRVALKLRTWWRSNVRCTCRRCGRPVSPLASRAGT